MFSRHDGSVTGSGFSLAVSASSVPVAELAMARIVAVSAVLALNATAAESAIVMLVVVSLISAMTTVSVIWAERPMTTVEAIMKRALLAKRFVSEKDSEDFSDDSRAVPVVNGCSSRTLMAKQRVFPEDGKNCSDDGCVFPMEMVAVKGGCYPSCKYLDRMIVRTFPMIAADRDGWSARALFVRQKLC